MKVSERSILVTVCASMALALCAVYAPVLVILFAVVAAAPFGWLRWSWKRDLRRRAVKRRADW